MKHFFLLPLLMLFIFTITCKGQQTICEDEAGLETYSVAPSNPANTFLWSSSSASVVFSSTNTLTTSVNWSGVNAGVYTISFTETNSIGCDSTVNLTVTINSSPTLTIATVEVCEGTVIAQVTANVVNGTQPITYNWGQPGNTATENLDLDLVGTGYNGGDISSVLNLTQSVTATDANGCSATVNTNIVDVVPNPEPGVITF